MDNGYTDMTDPRQAALATSAHVLAARARRQKADNIQQVQRAVTMLADDATRWAAAETVLETAYCDGEPDAEVKVARAFFDLLAAGGYSYGQAVLDLSTLVWDAGYKAGLAEMQAQSCRTCGEPAGSLGPTPTCALCYFETSNCICHPEEARG
jgi:hypothetical protein